MPNDLMELEKPKPLYQAQMDPNFVRAEQMDRNELVRKREEEKNRRINEKLQEKQNRDNAEASALSEKLEASSRLQQEMVCWAKTPSSYDVVRRRTMSYNTLDNDVVRCRTT